MIASCMTCGISASGMSLPVLVVDRRERASCRRGVHVADLRRRAARSARSGSLPNVSAPALAARPDIATAGKAAAATTTPASTPQISSEAALAKMLWSRLRIQVTATGYVEGAMGARAYCPESWRDVRLVVIDARLRGRPVAVRSGVQSPAASWAPQRYPLTSAGYTPAARQCAGKRRVSGFADFADNVA